MTREEYIKSNIDKIFYNWANIMMVSGAFLVLSLSLLDYYAVPSNFVKFLIYRIFAATGLLIIYFINKKKINSILQNSVVIAGGMDVAIMVALMVAKFDGHQSPYFAGFIVDIVYILTFIPISLRVGILIASMIYGAYAIPILFYDRKWSNSRYHLYSTIF